MVFLGGDEITCARSGLLVQIPPCSAQLGRTHPDVVGASRQGVEGAFTTSGLNFPASRLGSSNYNGILIILLHPAAARLFFRFVVSTCANPPAQPPEMIPSSSFFFYKTHL
jgi:hypothetical protein